MVVGQPGVQRNIVNDKIKGRGRGRPRHIYRKGKGQSDFSGWPLFMLATTYAPTDPRVR